MSVISFNKRIYSIDYSNLLLKMLSFVPSIIFLNLSSGIFFFFSLYYDKLAASKISSNLPHWMKTFFQIEKEAHGELEYLDVRDIRFSKRNSYWTFYISS